MIISNATPLIYLAKLGKIEILKKIFKKIVIPKKVYEEIVKGKEQGFTDSLIIERAIKGKWIEVRQVKEQEDLLKFSPELDIGEVAVLSLALKSKPHLILIDDASARAVAESFGFNVKGTIYILLRAYKKKILKKSEIKELIEKLISLGFRISSELYAGLIDKLG